MDSKGGRQGMVERRLVRCRECEAHFEGPDAVVFDNGAPDRGVDLRCPVCCVRGTYTGADVVVTAIAACDGL